VMGAITGDAREPVGGVVQRYYQPLNLEQVASEVGSTPAEVSAAIRFDRELRDVLLPLVVGGVVQREALESREQGESPVERLADVLRN
jgi:hypothetical protein